MANHSALLRHFGRVPRPLSLPRAAGKTRDNRLLREDQREVAGASIFTLPPAAAPQVPNINPESTRVIASL